MHSWSKLCSGGSLVVLLLLGLILLVGAQRGQEDDEKPAGGRGNVTVSVDEDTLHVAWNKLDISSVLDVRSYAHEVMLKAQQLQETVLYSIPSSQTSISLRCLRPETLYSVTVLVRYKFNNNTVRKDELATVEAETSKEVKGILSSLRQHRLYVIIGAVMGAVGVLLLAGGFWCACRGLRNCGRRRRQSVDMSFKPPSAKDLHEIEQQSFYQRRRNVYTATDVRAVSSCRSIPEDAPRGPVAPRYVPASQRTPLIHGPADLKMGFPASLPKEPAPPRPPLPAGKLSGHGPDEDEDSFDSDQEGYINSALHDEEPPVYGNMGY